MAEKLRKPPSQPRNRRIPPETRQPDTSARTPCPSAMAPGSRRAARVAPRPAASRPIGCRGGGGHSGGVNTNNGMQKLPRGLCCSLRFAAVASHNAAMGATCYVSCVHANPIRYTLHATCYTLHATCYMLHATCYMLHATRDMLTLHATCYMLHATCYTPRLRRDEGIHLQFGEIDLLTW